MSTLQALEETYKRVLLDERIKTLTRDLEERLVDRQRIWDSVGDLEREAGIQANSEAGVEIWESSEIGSSEDADWNRLKVLLRRLTLASAL